MSPGERIRVRGLVQGVGFRPTVWRLARVFDLSGEVLNDGEGVLIHAWGEPGRIELFCVELKAQCPPLARIDSLERAALHGRPAGDEFRIVASRSGEIHTGVVADAATCPACLAELFDPDDRRYRYPFINCTHCGPRLSIVERIPYDRGNTSMAGFRMCPDCRAEYESPADRRFHAQPNACAVCGPRVWLQDRDGHRPDPARFGSRDVPAAAARLLAEGHILGVKGIGGFHLACDAANPRAVAELRRRKRRYAKPFALMARDIQVIRRYCRARDSEVVRLAGPAAPILLLDLGGPDRVAPQVAPGQSSLGFMLPYSPLHHLLLEHWDRPLVMTSGNLSDEPQCTRNRDAEERLGDIADLLLLHDRAIVNRVDDSVARFMDGAPRLLRRARGYAPAPLTLPHGLGQGPPVLALGGELKNTVCLVAKGQAVLSQHLGDLEEARTAREYERTIGLYLDLFGHRPRVLAVDQHPDYRSTRVGRDWAARDGLALREVQHHHAHVAAVLADNRHPVDGGRVLGIALDGLGYGPDGTIWGGEFLAADYTGFTRLGWLAPTPLPGGTRAILEPWRSAFAQLRTHLGWEFVLHGYPGLDFVRWAEQKPLMLLERIIDRGINSPRTSSCGRLFDAVAAVVGICREGIAYEGQAAIELETLAQGAPGAAGGYPLGLLEMEQGLALDPAPMWEALLEDSAAGRSRSLIAMRFHQGLGRAVVDLAVRIAGESGLDTCALSGGVFQNRTLFEFVTTGLLRRGIRVLTHARVPTNDGGLSLGQATVASASSL